MQAEHVAHRDLLLKIMQQDAARAQLVIGPIFRQPEKGRSSK
jgi:hypothetical protein